jgi:succinate dehydrogenase flavin-adding protein (antitoxin of CptAB toxin-antitoxin module)
MNKDNVPEKLSKAADSDRPRGILTPSDRDFLLGRKTDYTEHSKKQKRNRIRRRVSNAILDFSILFEYLEERDRNTIFDPDDEDRVALTQGITDLLAFLHLGTMGYYTPFKDMLSEGVGKAEQHLADSNYRMVNVEFNVDPVGQIDVDEVVEKLENEEFAQVTDEELRAFVRLLTMSDEFSPESTREEIKNSMDEFTQLVTESADARDQKVEELTK